MALGASATALGQSLFRWRFELNLIGGAVVILFGLFMLGAARIQTMERDLRFNLDLPGGQPLGEGESLGGGQGCDVEPTRRKTKTTQRLM